MTVKSNPGIPRFKSDEYNVNFRAEEQKSKWIDWFRADGELLPETKIIIAEGDRRNEMRAYWVRKTMQGSEEISLFRILQSDGFLEFLHKFTEKKGFFNKKWMTDYKTLVVMISFCEKEQGKFRETVRKARTLEEMMIAAGFRD